MPDATLRLELKKGKRIVFYDLGKLLPNVASTSKSPLDNHHNSLAHGCVQARKQFVERCHQEIADIAAENSQTAVGAVERLFRFAKWLEERHRPLGEELLIENLRLYSDHLEALADVGKIKHATHLRDISTLGGLFDKAVNASDRYHYYACGLAGQLTREMRAAVTPKVTAEEASAFGHALVKLIEQLNVDAIHSNDSLPITLAEGKTLLLPARKNYLLGQKCTMSPSARYRINLRVDAERLVFIAASGMNMGQVEELQLGDCRYQSYSNSAKTKALIKNRLGGEVSFTISSAYKPHFERYQQFIMTICPNGTLLFPFHNRYGEPKHLSLMGMLPVRTAFLEIGLPYASPRNVRGIWANEIRKLLKNPAESASMAQHSLETHVRYYARIDPHNAHIELSQYQRSHSPYRQPPGPGACLPPFNPLQVAETPKSAPVPDCHSAGGCLFCLSRRGIKSEDYAWSLATFRHLKVLELAVAKVLVDRPAKHPIEYVLERVTELLGHLASQDAQCNAWVKAARERVAEGDYHPIWLRSILVAERL